MKIHVAYVLITYVFLHTLVSDHVSDLSFSCSGQTYISYPVQLLVFLPKCISMEYLMDVFNIKLYTVWTIVTPWLRPSMMLPYISIRTDAMQIQG